MTTLDLAKHLEAALLAPGNVSPMEIKTVYAGDRMSDLLSESSHQTLLVTHIANQGLIRLMELMDVPGICLVKNAVPGEEVIAAARECGAVLMVSKDGMFETCGRIYQLLHPNG